MSRTAYIGTYRGEGGQPSGRAVAFNRWLPLFAEAVGRQGGRAVEALTPHRFRDTTFHRLNAAVCPPTRLNRPLRHLYVRNVQPAPSRSRRTSTDPGPCREPARGTTFATRIRDLSRAALSAGAEIPVVREDKMSAGPIYLLNIPVEPRFRQTLRVYALPDVARPEVEVRYFRQPSPGGPRLDLEIHLLRVERIVLRSRTSTDEFNLFPAIAEVGNVETFLSSRGSRPSG